MMYLCSITYGTILIRLSQKRIGSLLKTFVFIFLPAYSHILLMCTSLSFPQVSSSFFPFPDFRQPSATCSFQPVISFSKKIRKGCNVHTLTVQTLFINNVWVFMVRPAVQGHCQTAHDMHMICTS